MYCYVLLVLCVHIQGKNGPIGGEKCYKIFDTSNTLSSPTVGGTKKINCPVLSYNY